VRKLNYRVHAYDAIRDSPPLPVALTSPDKTNGTEGPAVTVLSSDEETLIVAFRGHAALPLDDCPYALQATIRN
jgi:hypothetical protein